MVAIDPPRGEPRRRGNPVVVVRAFAARALRSGQLLSSVDTRQSDSTRPRHSLLLLDITYERRHYEDAQVVIRDDPAVTEDVRLHTVRLHLLLAGYPGSVLCSASTYPPVRKCYPLP